MSLLVLKRARECTRGAILILFLLLLPVLLSLVAFAIDLSIANGVREQGRAFTRLAALLAIEQYGDESPPVTDPIETQVRNRLTATLSRVNTILQRNFLISNPGESYIPLEYRWNPSDPTDAAQRWLIPGIVWFIAPPNPPASCQNSFPCFEEFNLDVYFANPANASITPPINAFRVDAQVLRNGIATKFANAFLGAAQLPIFASATASAIPRNIVFLVDLSKSSTEQTHRDRKISDTRLAPEEGVGAFYSFPRNSVVTALPATGCLPVPSPGTSPSNAVQQGYRCHWDFLDRSESYAPYTLDSGARHPRVRPATFPYSVPPTDPTSVHFFSDFNPGGVPNQAQITSYVGYNDPGKVYHPNPNAAGPTTFLQPTTLFYLDSYTPPEPLMSILTGVNSAIQGFQGRFTGGDRAGLILFERNLWWSRVVRLTDNFAYLRQITDSVPAGNGQPTLTPQMRQLGFFPSQENFTDLPTALNEAMDQLLAPGTLRAAGVPTADAVVYVGDFLTNISAATRTGGVQPVDRYEDYIPSVDEVVSVINNRFVPNQITFNVIHIGERVGPHVLDVLVNGSNPPRCYTESEARAQGKKLILGGDSIGADYQSLNAYRNAYRGMSSQAPFFEAAEAAYNIARATGGVYAPILQSTGCDPANPDTGCLNLPFPGRRLVDRQCRTQRQQIIDYMSVIIQGDSPFRIVDAS